MLLGLVIDVRLGCRFGCVTPQLEHSRSPPSRTPDGIFRLQPRVPSPWHNYRKASPPAVLPRSTLCNQADWVESIAAIWIASAKIICEQCSPSCAEAYAPVCRPFSVVKIRRALKVGRPTPFTSAPPKYACRPRIASTSSASDAIRSFSPDPGRAPSANRCTRRPRQTDPCCRCAAPSSPPPNPARLPETALSQMYPAA